MGIIVIVAGQAFSNSTKFRVRNQSMIEANEVAGNIAALIKDDIAQMGAKSALETKGASGTSDIFSNIPDEIFMPPVSSASTGSATSTASSASTSDEAAPDSSSFALLNAGNKSDLRFRRIHYGSDGKYQSIEEVRWFLDGDVLKRSCWTVKKQTGATLDEACDETTADKAEIVEIAEGVSGFSITAGEPKVKGEDEQLFPPTGNDFMLIPRFGEQYYNFLTVEKSGEATILKGFALNYNKGENKPSDAYDHPEQTEINQLFAAENETVSSITATSWKEFCSKTKNHFTLDSNVIYEISFNVEAPSSLDKMQMFNPGRDFLAVGLRNAKGERPDGLEDFLFYPPTSQATNAPKRSMRFSVKSEIKDVCLAFTFASFSPVTSEGTLRINNLKMKKPATANYEFSGWNTETKENIPEKKNVKAFKLSLSVKVNGEEGTVEEIIRTPSNGPRD